MNAQNERSRWAIASSVDHNHKSAVNLFAFLDYLHYLPCLCGKSVLGCTVDSETRNLSFIVLTVAIAQLLCWVNPMNIAQRSGVRHWLLFSCCWAQYFFCHTEVLCHVFLWRNRKLLYSFWVLQGPFDSCEVNLIPVRSIWLGLVINSCQGTCYYPVA